MDLSEPCSSVTCISEFSVNPSLFHSCASLPIFSASLLTVFLPQPHRPQFWCLNTALSPPSLRPFHNCASAGRLPLPVLHQARSFSSMSSQRTNHFFREACYLSSLQSPLRKEAVYLGGVGNMAGSGRVTQGRQGSQWRAPATPEGHSAESCGQLLECVNRTAQS